VQRHFIRCSCSMILEILLKTTESLKLIVSVPISHPTDPIFESGGYHEWYFSSSFSSVAPKTPRSPKSGHLSCMRSRRVTALVVLQPLLIVVTEIIRKNKERNDSVVQILDIMSHCVWEFIRRWWYITLIFLLLDGHICYAWILATLWERYPCT
jgi:hypothetical protein